MPDFENCWKRLEIEFASVMQTLNALEASARQRQIREDIERLGPARARAETVIDRLRREARSGPDDWKAWVEAETAWLEFRFEMAGLVVTPGKLREDYLASLAGHIDRLEKDIDRLVTDGERFRPRTRLAINQAAERLHRRLEVLREEARRVRERGTRADRASVRAMGQAWSEVEWEVEETKKRFARPRRRQGPPEILERPPA